jgi:UDP-4-amino-4,6-dideoxy-N-acetyl-beta-L-altrosamine transaminase
MISYGRQSIGDDDVRAVVSTLMSDFITQGPKVTEFETALANYCGAFHCAVASNGTAALHLAYLAAGICKDDEVIVTPNTFVATTNMILACGAKPVFCDIRSDTYNIDEGKIEELITKNTRAIVVVDFAGQPCNLDRIREIANKHKLVFIEDACHALGADYKGRKVGGLADFTIFSFHPVKGITTGEGGAILTNNKDAYEKMCLIRSHGVVKDENGFNIMTEFGFNYRLTDIQCALGLSQLKKLDRFITKRHAVVQAYERELGNFDKIILPKTTDEVRSAWHLYVIRVKDREKRLPLHHHLRSKGILTNLHYPAVYNNPYYRKNGFGDVALANMDLYAETAITIPCYPDLPIEQIKFICNEICSFYN